MSQENRDQWGNWLPEVAKARREASRKAKADSRPVLRLVRRDGKPLGTVRSERREKKQALRERVEALAGSPVSARQLKRGIRYLRTLEADASPGSESPTP